MNNDLNSLGQTLSKVLPAQQIAQPSPITPQVIDQAAQQIAQPQSSQFEESPQLDPNNPWQDFINRAQKVAQIENFPVSVLLGQAALESSHGKSPAGQHNYFGLKGIGNGPNGGQAMLPTQEYGPNGYYNENSGFATFATPEDNMRAYINLIKETKNYQNAYQQWLQDHNDLGLLQGIKAGGYATDPTYIEQVSSMPEFAQNQNQ